jgi:STE24 endopeptidase
MPATVWYYIATFLGKM